MKLSESVSKKAIDAIAKALQSIYGVDSEYDDSVDAKIILKELADAGLILEENWQSIETLPDTGEFLLWDGVEQWLVCGGKDSFSFGYPKENGCGCCSYSVENGTMWRRVSNP